MKIAETSPDERAFVHNVITAQRYMLGNTNTEKPTWETMAAFSKRTGISIPTIRLWMKRGALPYLRTSNAKQGRVLLHRGQTDAALTKLTRNLVQSTASAA